MTLEQAYALAIWTVLIFIGGIKFDHYLAQFFSQFFEGDDDIEGVEEEEEEEEGEDE